MSENPAHQPEPDPLDKVRKTIAHESDAPRESAPPTTTDHNPLDRVRTAIEREGVAAKVAEPMDTQLAPRSVVSAQTGRLAAAAAHATAPFSPFLIGIFLPAIVFFLWSGNGRFARSESVRFQAAQALGYHVFFAAAMWAIWSLVAGIGSIPILGWLAAIPLVLIAGLVSVALIAYPLWAAIRTFSGHPFKYAFIGDFVRGFLGD